MEKEHRSSDKQPERQGHQDPFSRFASDLQQRYVNRVTSGVVSPEELPAEGMMGLLARMKYDARLSGSEAAQDAANRTRWAFLALTYPHYTNVHQRTFIEDYN